jgi:2,3-bisphosphoglycerate-dependent phosphoglycerate mutase
VATEVFYVRHGEIAAKVPGDPGLSSAGVAMARQAGRALATKGPVAVLTSPLARAAETATVVAAACGVDAVHDPRLRERLNWGDIPGQIFDDFVELWDRCAADRHLVPPVPVGRSACRAGCGVIELLDSLGGVPGDGPIVLVAHGGLLVDLLLCLAAAGRAAPVDPAVDVPYCSITHLRWDEQVDLHQLAATAHLTEVRTTRSE